MKKLLMGVGAGLVLCLLANVAQAAGLAGSYAYKLVLRDNYGFVLSGCETDEGDERVSSNYALEVYNSSGEKLKDVAVEDRVVGVGGAEFNCLLTVPVRAGEAGCANVGEQLTLVVRDKSFDFERFRSSKVLPPVGGSAGVAPASVGVFRLDADEVDYGYDLWLLSVELYSGKEIGGLDEDADQDGLSNLREYQLGTDPVGGDLMLWDTPEFAITDHDTGYEVEFNVDPCHVYSIRAVDQDGLGEDLELYDADNHNVSCGKFVYEQEDFRKRRYFVQKPTNGALIDLAVDGRLLSATLVGPSVTLPATPTGYSYVVSNVTAGAALWGRRLNDQRAYTVSTGDVVTVYFTLKPGYVFKSGDGTPKSLGAITEDKTVTADEMPKALALMGVAAFGAEKTYDGEPTNVTWAVTNYLGEAIADATIYLREPGGAWVTADQFTEYVDVTNATVEVKAEKTDWTTATNQATVAIAPRAVTLTSGSKTWVYNGHAHSNMTVTVGSAGFVAGQGVGTNDFATITNAGTVSNAFAYAFLEGTKAENYSVSCVTGTLTVTAMPVDDTVTMAAAGDAVYDGLGHEPQPAVSNVVLGVELSVGTDFDYDWESNTNAGTAKVIAVFKGNYTGALTNEFTVNRATLDPLSGFDTTNVYDGVAHTIDTNALEQAYADKFLGNAPSFSYALQSNGTYVAEAPTFTDVTVTSVWYKITADNFNDVIHSAKVIVTNRCVTLTSGSETWIYDGQAHSNATVSVGGAGFVAGQGVTTNGFPTITEVGSVPNAFAYEFLDGTDAANYNVTCVTGTLAVAGYWVSYDGAGAAGSMETDLFIPGVRTNLTANAYTAVGYSFLGWTTNGTNKLYDDRATGVNFAAPGETLALKAFWDDTGETVTTFVELTNALVTATNQTLAVRVEMASDVGVPPGGVVKIYGSPKITFEGAGKIDVSGFEPQFGQPVVVGEGFAKADLALFDGKNVVEPRFKDGKVYAHARGETEGFPWLIGPEGSANATTMWMTNRVLYAKPMRGTASVEALVAVTNLNGGVMDKVVTFLEDGTPTNVVMLLGDDGVPYGTLAEVFAAKPMPTTVRLFEVKGAYVEYNAMGGVHTNGLEVLTNFYTIAYERLPEVTRKGYEFIGWFDGWTNGTQVVTNGMDLLRYEPHSLYAKWKSNYPTPTEGELDVTDVKDGEPVTEIAANAYKSHATLESVTTPLYLTSIGQTAFYAARNLKSLTITSPRDYDTLAPVALTIGRQAFGGTALEEVIIPDLAAGSKIEYGAFYNCPQLKRIVFLGDQHLDCDATAFQRCGTGTLAVYMSSAFQAANPSLVENIKAKNPGVDVHQYVGVSPVVGSEVTISDFVLTEHDGKRLATLRVSTKMLVPGTTPESVKVKYSTDGMATWQTAEPDCKIPLGPDEFLLEVSLPLDAASLMMQVVVE